MRLVERILITLVKLLLAEFNALLSSQTRVLLFNLWHASRLKRRIRSLVSSLRVAVNLGVVLVGKGQGIESVIDTRGMEGRGLGVAIQLREIETAGLLGCGFGAATFGLGRLRGFFGGEQGVTFGLLAGCLGLFGFSVFSVVLECG